MVCSGHGTCVASGQCNCNSNYTGACCASIAITQCLTGFVLENAKCVPVCFNRSASNSQVCTGNGVCSGPSNCTCKVGYAGQRCSTCASGYTNVTGSCILYCFNIASTNASVCSGRGKCIATNSCLCESGFMGRACNQSSLNCPPNFVQIGSTCQPLCFGLNVTDERVCSGRGSCIGVNLCSCYEGYNGTNCSIVLPLNCQTGFAESNRVCVPTCFGAIATNASACFGSGVCVGVNDCQCFEGYYGTTCNITCQTGSKFVDGKCIFECYGVLASSPNVCFGNGSCIGFNICNCTANYTGSECEKEKEIICPPSHILNVRTKACLPSCCGRISTDQFACGGSGTCIAPGVCACRPGFSGPCCLTYGGACELGYTYVNGSCQGNIYLL